ncbi:MAG: hypothetical protein M3525_02935 [Acidobacteriota bacterium]|nr:hypothetical protein [Acidobacteriota bacterium]
MTKNMNGNLFEVEEAETIQSKKAMILSLYNSGTKEIETIAAISGAKPSYVGSVLQKEGLIDNYFDLYTSNAHPKNVYSKHFQGKLGFKDVFTARRSVNNLEESYNFFADRQDRAGQHHALEMALTMLDRARWTGKLEEAEIYRRWLVNKLSAPLTRVADAKSQMKKAENTEELNGEKVQLKRAA